MKQYELEINKKNPHLSDISPVSLVVGARPGAGEVDVGARVVEGLWRVEVLQVGRDEGGEEGGVVAVAGVGGEGGGAARGGEGGGVGHGRVDERLGATRVAEVALHLGGHLEFLSTWIACTEMGHGLREIADRGRITEP